MQEAGTRKQAAKEARRRELELEANDAGLFGQGFGRGAGGAGAPMRDVHGRPITNLRDMDAVRLAAAPSLSPERGGGGADCGGGEGATSGMAPPVGGFRRGLLDPTAPEDVAARERARKEMADALSAQVAEKQAKKAAARAEEEREAVREQARDIGEM